MISKEKHQLIRTSELVPLDPGKMQAWLDKSAEFLAELKKRNQAGDIAGRNKFIDSKSAHWGKLKPWLQLFQVGNAGFRK